MAFWHRRKEDPTEEQERWYGRFRCELLDRCAYLQSTARPEMGRRYGEIWAETDAFIRLIESALAGPDTALPKALAQLLFDLFYTDKAVADHLAALRIYREHLADQFYDRLSDLEALCRSRQEALQRAEKTAGQALETQRVLYQELAERDREIERLNKHLQEKEKYIREQNRVIARLQDDLNRRYG